ncbi:MAG: hypothetical protein CMG08_00580, partial [Candidatus Marinimicrobia bacterium]|nr:hypothetical protein [Candidatus Neomarinimicrobiota bacterium]
MNIKKLLFIFLITFNSINELNAQSANNQVYGFISDSLSGEALIGANVFIRETGQGMATDNNGYYVLSEISISKPTLIVSYVGYSQYEMELDFSQSNSLNVMVSL